MLDRYIQLYEEGVEKHSQLCIYHEGRKVVDIWGEYPGLHKGLQYDGEVVTPIWSSGKSLASICMAFLHD